MAECRLVGYLRVSTVSQGESGLGLEGQQAAIDAYTKATGCELLTTYTEVETGKEDTMDNRPELLRAIAHAKRSKATLVIAKLDRLSRSVWVTACLHKSKVDFVACDNPNVDKRSIQFLAIMAENETQQISERTKAALRAYKARGGVLGAARPECRNLTDDARRKGAQAAGEVARVKAAECYGDVLPDMLAWRSEGMTLQQIADRLNSLGKRTRNQKLWGHVQVKRILDRSKP